VRERDDKDDQPGKRSEHGHEHDSENDLRESEDDIHQPHQRTVDAATAIAGNHSDSESDQHAKDRGGQGHPQQGAAAVQHSLKNVLSEEVGAQKSLSGGADEGCADKFIGVTAAEERSEER
jgi:hypothetical protein